MQDSATILLAVLISTSCLEVITLRQADKDVILKAHNDARNDIARCKLKWMPPAKSMPMLQWDENLANGAQRWSNTCRQGHNTYAERKTIPYRNVGQNWAGSSSALENALKLWEAEKTNFNDYQGKCAPGQMCGHYTQMIWAKTTHVGCGVTDCSPSGGFKTTLVCDYGEGGNYIGQFPYEQGNTNDCVRS